uniref:Tetratricopeptide repeat-containing protein n=1 Tax=Candidatus Kentrum sp. FW TaxID=2126338 RepID=A0A450SU09_9GAMM|nr:MAG: Tetratricopeptide repeat-containing protein [Candidatus Kentron sp. FW]
MRGSGWISIGLILFSLLGCEDPPGDGPRTEGFRTAGPELAGIRANNRGVGLMGRFEYSAAAEVFARLMAQYPHWSDVRLNLAIAILNRQKEGDEQAALALADEVLVSHPDHLRAHYVAGLLRLYLSSPADAIEHFARVAEADPNDAYAAYYLGQCLAQQSEPEKALAEYRRALAIDPYLRSAAYGAFQALQRLQRRQEARDFITQYQRLAMNPRARLAEFKYTRMGPKANALALDVGTQKQDIPPPQGPVFARQASLPLKDNTDLSPLLSASPPQEREKDARPISMTVMDLDSDGYSDLFVAGVSTGGEGQRNLLLSGTPEGRFVPRKDHPLTRVPDVNGALWGDFDNDGQPDVYLCRRGENQLWRNSGKDIWIDVTASTGTGNGIFDTVDGAFFDADHDGDLDLFLINRDGPDGLLHNNLDGTFRTDGVKMEKGDWDPNQAPSLAVIPSDPDRDRDADIIVLNRAPPHRVYINDRLWAYHASRNFHAFQSSPALSATVGDIDADGYPEIYTLTPHGVLIRWSPDSRGDFVAQRLSCVSGGDSRFPCLAAIDRDTLGKDADTAINPTIPAGTPWAQMAIFDANGDGLLELLIATPGGWSVLSITGHSRELPGKSPEKALKGKPIFTALAAKDAPLLGVTPMLQKTDAGYGLVGLSKDADSSLRLVHWQAGPGRHPFLALKFSGMEDPGKSMRSNASGIGARMAVRVGTRWTIAENFRDHSGPGQNLQPVPIGLGGAPRLDFVAIDWSDGVFQSELDLEAGRLHHITETQRQLSSCPVLFAWDGEKYRFVTDFLGVGGIGYAIGPGEYGTPRPWENLLLSSRNVRPRQGRYVFKLTEPMEEAAYMDALRLVVYDLPPGWRMVLDERMGIEGPQPTGATIFYRRQLLPKNATNERGETVTASVIRADGRAASPGALDRRFIGRLAQEHILTLDFPEEIRANRQDPSTSPDPATVHTPILVIDGWVEYPYSQTMFAAWQANAAWQAPTIEALDQDGVWRTVLARFGYPAGMPRTMSVPLPDLPPGTSMLRLRTNQEIYWDRIAIAFPESLSSVRKLSLPMESARLRLIGFPERVDGPQRYPRFHYERRRPFQDTRPMAGLYTRYGPVEELLREIDDAIAIFGAGEEIHVEFAAPSQPPPPGWQRYLVLQTHGWTKDRDLYTKDGETVGPLPKSGKPPQRRQALHARYNTRYVGQAGHL